MKVKGFEDTIDWYNNNAEKFAGSVSNLYPVKNIDDFVRLLPIEAKILDAGCGSGRDTDIFSKRGFIIEGIDISEGLINVAKKTFPGVKFTVGNLLELPYENNIFDGVWSNASLLHFEKISQVEIAISEFGRVLKNAGILYILVKAQTGEKKTAIVSDSVSNHDRFFRYFKLAEIQKMVEYQRFKILDIEQYNEAERIPNGRPEVEWIKIMARKEE